MRIIKKPVMVHGGMKYKCHACDAEYFIHLEVGVEDFGENGRPHQPCPFIIECPTCGGVSQDISGRIEFPNIIELQPNKLVFSYDTKHEDGCGILSKYEGDTE